MEERAPSTTTRVAGSRYELLVRIASGGMGTVYVGRLRGAAGYSRLVAIKRAHPHLSEDAAFRRLLVQEARLGSKIHHPNAVVVQDVEELDGELLLVMDYVHGVSLADLIKVTDPEVRRLEPRVAVRVVLDACAGLHAAHTATDDDDTPLGIVHRDVSPQNVLVGVNGVARLTDFGIAKSFEQDRLTTGGVLRGKVGYLAPEYVADGRLDPRSDVFAMGVVLWEALAGRRLFRSPSDMATLKLVLAADAPPVSEAAPWIGDSLDAVLARALARAPAERFASAEELATRLEEAARGAGLVGTAAEVGAVVRELHGADLDARRARMQRGDGEAEDTAEHRLEPADEGVPASTRPDVAPGFGGEATTFGHASMARIPSTVGPRRSLFARVAFAAALIGAVTISVVSVLWRSDSGRDGTREAPAREAPAREDAPQARSASAPPASGDVSDAPEPPATATATPPATAATTNAAPAPPSLAGHPPPQWPPPRPPPSATARPKAPDVPF
jgi:eukaryotic-like serine/threonine-protein kinase